MHACDRIQPIKMRWVVQEKGDSQHIIMLSDVGFRPHQPFVLQLPEQVYPQIFMSTFCGVYSQQAKLSPSQP